MQKPINPETEILLRERKKKDLGGEGFEPSTFAV
jgi:hypothetical protein